jgi:hypothetical protein
VSSLLVDWEIENFVNKTILKYLFFFWDTKGVDYSLNGMRAALVSANKNEVILDQPQDLHSLLAW